MMCQCGWWSVDVVQRFFNFFLPNPPSPLYLFIFILNTIIITITYYFNPTQIIPSATADCTAYCSLPRADGFTVIKSATTSAALGGFYLHTYNHRGLAPGDSGFVSRDTDRRYTTCQRGLPLDTPYAHTIPRYTSLKETRGRALRATCRTTQGEE